MASLEVADVRKLGDFVQFLSVVDGRPFPVEVVEALGELVPCLDVAYFEKGDCCALVTAGELEFPPWAIEAMSAYCLQLPTAPEHLSAADGAVKLSDRIGRRALVRLEFYQEVMRPLGIADDITLVLPTPMREAACFSFTRGEPFTRRDLTILNLLAPHLARARARMATRHAVDLTEREWDVMEWLAQGKTNKEIAALTGVTPNTVRKHLENIFAKLGVHTRTAAVARAFSRDG